MSHLPDKTPSPHATLSVRDATEIHAALDRVLLAQGEYAPLELLIDQGRLDYSAYEAWRCGELTDLDDALLGNRARIRSMLDTAARWAQRLRLKPFRADYEGWGPSASKTLTLCSDPGLGRALATHYRRDETEAQLDMFLDSGEVALLNELCSALAARRTQRAVAALGDFVRRSPRHRLRADAERLCDALAYLEADAEALPPEAEFFRLREHLEPAATKVLGARRRDFLAPFWRRLAHRLEGRAFDPATPELHGSWLYAQCLDWRGVQTSVLADTQLTTQPVLLERLAEAECRLGERVPAISRLALLCWRYAEQAEALLDTDGFPDTGVRHAWETFQDLDLEPPVDSAWFPAWLLLSEPGLAKAWQTQPPAEAGAAGGGFDALRELLTAPRDATDAAVIAMRQALGQCHRGFLGLFLEWCERRRV